MQIADKLKEKGYRLTKPRQELIKVLAHYPITAQDIYLALRKKNIQIDLASVYRSLMLFVEMGIVREVDFNENKKRYEIVDKNNHHHHFVCSNCRAVEDVIINENELLKAITKKSKFKINHHNLEFFGLCQNCQ